jgi:protein-tyrosine kinase
VVQMVTPQPKGKSMNENAAVPLSTTPLAPVRANNMGRLLLDRGKLSPEGAEQVVRLAKETGMRFGEAAVQLGLVTEADIQQVLADQFDYPYLHHGEGKYSDELVAAFQPFSTHVETLRAVRSQLMLRWFSEQRKALAVVCVNAGEGASFIAANLAVVFSQLGEHTLLVDANLRNPRQQALFQLEQRQGLSDILAGRADLDVITKVQYFVDLSVLSSGTLPPNPQELLSRTTFREFTQKLANRYDVVIYDAPAFSTAADLMAVAACTEGALLITRKNKTRIATIRSLKDQFERNGIEVVGSLMLDF